MCVGGTKKRAFYVTDVSQTVEVLRSIAILQELTKLRKTWVHIIVWTEMIEILFYETCTRVESKTILNFGLLLMREGSAEWIEERP